MSCFQLHPDCKSSCCVLRPDCKDVTVPRARHTSETKFVFDVVGLDQVTISSGDEQELEKGFELLTGVCINVEETAASWPGWILSGFCLPSRMR